MKQLLVFIAIIGLGWQGQAQSEFTAKFKAIPAAKFPIAPKKATEHLLIRIFHLLKLPMFLIALMPSLLNPLLQNHIN